MLAAGALGSTEILLRSQERGLSLSPTAWASGFTGNGDVLGFAYNNDVARERDRLRVTTRRGREPVGPCIAGIIDLRERPELDDGMVIEEGRHSRRAGTTCSPAPFAGARSRTGRQGHRRRRRPA